MTSDVEIEVTPRDEGSYVDWPAIIAGIVLASAISILLLAFGSAVGLGFADFRERGGASPIWLAIAAGVWLLWVQLSSFMAGGYLTGRLRRRHGDATEDESDVRDGAHGLLVWAGALVVGAILAISGVGALANVVGSTTGALTGAVATAAGQDDLDPNAYLVDLLFRPAPQTTATDAGEAPPAPAQETVAPTVTTPAPVQPQQVPAEAAAGDIEAARGEVTRIFAHAAADDLRAGDRAYLVQLVADRTTLDEQQASARVDEVMTLVGTARNEAVEAAETARRTGVVGAFLIAATFLVSAIGAYWAAQKGGNHRDKGTTFPGVFRRF